MYSLKQSVLINAQRNLLFFSSEFLCALCVLCGETPLRERARAGRSDRQPSDAARSRQSAARSGRERFSYSAAADSASACAASR